MRKRLFFLLVTILSFTSYSQNSGDIEHLYGIQGNLDSQTTAIQSDGKILVGGKFTTYIGNAQNYIIRLNIDGTLDASFNIGTGFNNYVNAIFVQSDGKILVGGNFTSYNGASQNYITRLNVDGSRDTSFVTGTGFSNEVLTLTRQSDGKILAGGRFTTYNGTIQNYITRLNPNGALDTSFLVSNRFNGAVKALSIQTDGKIVVGGSFTSYFGSTANHLIRLNNDGSRDAVFNIGSGFSNDVLTLALQHNGKLLIGGSFRSYNGISQNYITRLNGDGNYDTTFNSVQGFDSDVNSMTLQTDGKIIVGGSFTIYNNTAQNRISRLLPDGNLDTNFNIGNGFDNGGFTSIVRSIALQSNGKIIVGGTFIKYKQIPTQAGITCINIDGSNDLIFNGAIGFNSTGAINTIVSQSDGKAILGGYFTSYKGLLQNRISRLNPDGAIDLTFNSGIGFNAPVNILFLQSDGKILVGGNFTSYNGTIQNHIIRLNTDGSVDASFNIGSGFNDRVTSIAVQSDGKILIGGYFTLYNGSAKNYLIRLLTNGSIDTTFNSGTGFNAYVNTIAIQSNGKILAGGEFTSYNGNTQNHITRLNSNGSLDTSFNIGTGFWLRVLTLVLQNDGKILVGGLFTFYNNLNQNHLIRLNTDGTKDTSFNIGNGPDAYVSSFALQPDGKIIIGGYFTTYNYDVIKQNYITRLNTDGTRDTGFNSGIGFNNYVYVLALQSDGNLLVGGAFDSYNNKSSVGLIRLFTNNTLGFKNFDLQKVIIYPNPVKDILHLQTLDNSNYKYEMFNLQGKKVLSGTTFSNEINMINLEKGIYILKLKDDENSFNYKILKK
ncbi:T9SS type A sorting domain-containing protein [Flavobacterium sp. LS1R10]|uniref:T9SS type A sorting domain-containing protein n=1 Tax=Flavobacterium sp. LS1R10 TaxID=2497482 RepID=UPI000F81A013|nr:T9SS type A sorting domain-containing protein [Flavobacterium sp. LS1R10]RTY76280.1 T9SS type A sorting domain-containing protein [Flavobacterium sp. LS1R10]